MPVPRYAHTPDTHAALSQEEKRLREREAAFDTKTLTAATRKDPLPSYNALFDTNLRHFFENRRVQKHLYGTGLIDREGRIIDLEKNKAKLSIIEQEFRSAEREEELRSREEEEMRRRVQLKRHEALDKARLAERMMKMKEDRRIRREIVRVTRGEMMGGSAASVSSAGGTKKKKKIKRRKAKGGAGAGAGAGPETGTTAGGGSTFMTEGHDGDALDVHGGGGEYEEDYDEGEDYEY